MKNINIFLAGAVALALKANQSADKALQRLNSLPVPAKGDKGDPGDKGEKGDAGEQGETGKDVYNHLVDLGYEGTMEDFEAGLSDVLEYMQEQAGGVVAEGETKFVSGGDVFGALVSANALVAANVLVSVPKKNLIDPASINFTKRYSPSGTNIANRGATVTVSSGHISVKAGEWYVFSENGGYINSPSGGYFAGTGNTAVQSIAWTVPVDGKGRCFQVPVGLGITHVVLNLFTVEAGSDVFVASNQLEAGEQATDYEPYQLKNIFNPAYTQVAAAVGSSAKLEALTNLEHIGYNVSEKMPLFRSHWLKKDKDLVVVGTGTSLTGRTIEHCTEHVRAAERPPLMNSNNFASHIWDRLCWDNQFYRRYDFPGAFAETGSFQTQSNIADWDDGPYRAGLTRYSNGAAASISFSIPQKAWQYNLIYRSDSVATEAATIAVAGGDGLVEVWNGSAWVEANAYVFSQRESAVSVLASITNVNPETGSNQTLTNYQVKGNTTYQKRLKMRCKSGAIDSRNETKSVTISAASGRLTYWGVEWSRREYMITYINAARGSHSSLISAAETNLSKYQDNEIWGFRPDLILSEDPIHNSGAAGNLTLTRPKSYYGRVTESFFFDEDNGVSIVASANRHSLPVPEMLLFNSSIAWNFNGIDSDGNLIVYNIVDGSWTALDAQTSCYLHVSENHPDVLYINAVQGWVDAAVKVHGDMKTATQGSGKTGKTFTNEGSHWNDTGSRIMARLVLPALNFIS